MRRLLWLPVIVLGCSKPAPAPLVVTEPEPPAAGPLAARVPPPPPAQQPQGDKPPPGSRDIAKAPDEPAENDTRPDLWVRKGGTDWPSFNGPNRDCTSPEKGIIAPWPEDGLRVVWQKKLGGGYAPPTVCRGRVFLFERFGDNHRLSARNAETGKLLWTFEYPTDYEDQFGYSNGPRCCPVVDGDKVFIHGPEGMLHCVNALDGKPVWKVDTQKKFGFVQNFFGVGSTPTVEGDLLIVAVGGSPPGSDPSNFMELKGNGSGIVAFDKQTGSVKYSVTDELAGYASPLVTTINGRRWGFQFARGGLVGFEPASGKVDFHFPWRADMLESVNASNPVVVGDLVLVSECYSLKRDVGGAALLRVRPGGYDVVWSDADRGRDKRLKCHWMTPVHVGGYVYGSSGRNTPEADLRCVELATGQVMWRKPIQARSSLLHVDGHFVCLTEDGVLLLLKLSAKGCEEVSRLELAALDYPCWAAPVLAHGLMYVRGKDRLVCLELIPPKK